MKKLKEYLTKKEVIIFLVSLLIILLASFSYAFYYSVDNREEDVFTTECFKTTFVDENDINLENAYPMSDTEGSRLTPYTFTIKNICNKAGEYQVNVETKEESSLSTNYLRYKLNSYSSDILGQQLEVQEYINDNISESRNIEAGVILPNEEITYNLRLWIDETSTVSQSANKLYKGKVVIKTIENKEPYQTITLNANGGQLTHNEIVKVKQRKFGSIEEPERDGYYFEDWFSDVSLTNRVDENTIVTSTITNLYAKWVAREDTPYTVEHYQMDTSGNYPSTPYETDNLEGTSDTSVTPDVKTYTGFTSPTAQTANINSDGSLAVKYYYSRNQYTITFNANGGSVSPTSASVYYNGTTTLPTPTRTDYDFQGWYSATSGGTKYTNATQWTSAKTIYAQWKIKTVTVTFNANGGSVSTTSSTIDKGSKLSSLPTPTRSNYVFMGWYDSTSCTNKITTSTTFSANKTIYAHWLTNNGVNFVKGLPACYDSNLLTDGTSDNSLRYVGASPNNYVKFNNENWRIIGAINNVKNSSGTSQTLLKIIRATAIGSYAWDTSANSVNLGYGVNQWGASGSYEGADLMRELNYDYLGTTNVGSYWYDGRNNQKTTAKPSTTINSTAQAMIESVVWYTGSPNNNSGSYIAETSATLKPPYVYTHERASTNGKICTSSDYCNDTVTRTSTWTGKVAVFYPSDFLYATSGGSTANRTTCLNTAMGSSGWGSSTYAYCKNNDWLRDSSNWWWTISPYTETTSSLSAFLVSGDGYVYHYDTREPAAIKPVVYLKSSIKITGGAGTSSNPYTLST